MFPLAGHSLGYAYCPSSVCIDHRSARPPRHVESHQSASVKSVTRGGDDV